MGDETEIKLKVSPAALGKIESAKPICKRQVAERRAADVISVYYDTRHRDLHKRGVTFRLRRQGNEHLQTIKADADGYPRRKEWETKVAGNKPDFAAAKGTALEPLIGKKFCRKLKPVFQTRVRRKVMPLNWAGSEIDLALDRGHLRAGRSHLPINEVELELKRGEAANLFSAARTVAKVPSVRLDLSSKAERGYALADKKINQAVKRSRIVLGRKLCAADAFRTIGNVCLRQIVANEPAVDVGCSEGVHQMRVGLRQLRSALSIFSEVIGPDPEIERVKDSLKWITGELGPARDLDVYLRSSVVPLGKAKGPPRGARVLRRVTTRRRDEAFMRAGTAVRSDRYRALILHIAEWLHNGAWINQPDKTARACRERRAVKFAAEELNRRWRKIAKKSNKFDRLDAHERHKLRIAAKKLRYGIDFFASLFRGRKLAKRRRTLTMSLKRLQSSLGKLNDFAVHTELAEQLVFRKDTAGAYPRRRAFAAGVVSGRESANSPPLLRKAKRALHRVEKSRGYWK